MSHFVEDKDFERIDYTTTALPKGEYEGCVFKSCNFSGVTLVGSTFAECEFVDCNLSMANLAEVTLNDVQFTSCKMLGLRFDSCNEFLFDVSFDRCALNFCSFYKRKVRKVTFRNCSLLEADFTEADLTGAHFTDCDLNGTVFYMSNLEGTDFRSALNYSFDPALNKVKKAKFSMEGLPGLLSKFDIEVE